MPTVPQRLHLTSRDYTGRDKTDALREFYGRELMRVELQPFEGSGSSQATQDGLDFASTMLPLGGDSIYVQTDCSPSRMWRSPEMLRDGDDALYLAVAWGGGIFHTPNGSHHLTGGQYAIVSKARAHEFINLRGGASACIQVPHAALARRVARLEEAPLRLLPLGMPEPALAMGYAQLLASSAQLSAPLLQSALSHLQELMARILAPAAQAPVLDALDVPRMALIRRDILARIDRVDLSLAQIARLHHLAPRQVQRLFEREGTCFSNFLSEARLQRARDMLADPAQRQRRVLEIALDNGFADVSAFSRAFRRQFGMSPSEARGTDTAR
ncbi:helix-turn-helix transcriptional regulator [Ottowia sp. VDI28]|uniref:helix-turn-helix transcriptional regulator n=1 Tax=Ottowia sp. VDI28 TaxID=3133968 RepID=UPI003C2E94D1